MACRPGLLDCCLSPAHALRRLPDAHSRPGHARHFDPERRASRALANGQILAGCAKADPSAAEAWLHSPSQGAGDSDLSSSVIRLTIGTLYARLTT